MMCVNVILEEELDVLSYEVMDKLELLKLNFVSIFGNYLESGYKYIFRCIDHEPGIFFGLRM